jgi:hypothetical protein
MIDPGLIECKGRASPAARWADHDRRSRQRSADSSVSRLIRSRNAPPLASRRPTGVSSPSASAPAFAACAASSVYREPVTIEWYQASSSTT